MTGEAADTETSRRGQAQGVSVWLFAPAALSLVWILAFGAGCGKSEQSSHEAEIKTTPSAASVNKPPPETGTNNPNPPSLSATDQSVPNGIVAATANSPISRSDAEIDELARWHQTGGELIQSRRFEEAIEIFQQVLQKKPDDEEAHFNLGYCFARLTQMDLALHHYSEAIRILPEYAEAHNNLGNLLARQGHTDKAMEHFRAAIQNAPENASAHNNLGTTFIRLGKIEQAIPSFEEASRLNTNYVEAHYNLGRAYQSQGRIQEAIKRFERTIQIDPSFEYGRSALKKVLNQPKATP